MSAKISDEFKNGKISKHLQQMLFNGKIYQSEYLGTFKIRTFLV